MANIITETGKELERSYSDDRTPFRTAEPPVKLSSSKPLSDYRKKEKEKGAFGNRRREVIKIVYEREQPDHRGEVTRLLLEIFFPYYHVNARGISVFQELAELKSLFETGLGFYYEDLASKDAKEIAEETLRGLPPVREMLKRDVIAAYQGDPVLKENNYASIICDYPGFLAIAIHRVTHLIYKAGSPSYARCISEHIHSQTGIDIHPGASIDTGLFIDHGTGVVIGETAEIGKNVRIYQGVTLGAKKLSPKEVELCRGKARHPIVEDDVIIYGGATILGRVRIGNGSEIGGNVWLTKDVEPNKIVTLEKPKIVKRENGK